tara:strand:- start:18237 stop:18980 length:744 start_codon:yes stop_codon:yes gene_type:complete
MHKINNKLISIILPVLNERATFNILINKVIQKEIPGCDKEIIIIEGNSSDGTREDVLKYKDTPGIKIILTSSPKGKGHAVRKGLKEAEGDIILIQDGDLEYDVNDYDKLIKPIIDGQCNFVLGSRHSGSEPMRRFLKSNYIAVIMNFGHKFFCLLINLMYGVNLQDPFTMYKVFKSSCIKNLKFECNRFDFDSELVIKLIRSGTMPIEIPIKYVSRPYGEGKKVTFFWDPLTWLWAIIKYKFVSPYK